MKIFPFLVTFFVTVLSVKSEKPSSRLFQGKEINIFFKNLQFVLAESEPVWILYKWRKYLRISSQLHCPGKSSSHLYILTNHQDLFKFFFNALGYLISTILWTWYRGEDLPTTPDSAVSPLQTILDSLYSDQTAATTIAIAAGYVRSVNQSFFLQIFLMISWLAMESIIYHSNYVYSP